MNMFTSYGHIREPKYKYRFSNDFCGLIVSLEINLCRFGYLSVAVLLHYEKSFLNVLHSPFPLLSILEAVLTVSPNKQYLGIFNPTTPATHPPDRQ